MNLAWLDALFELPHFSTLTERFLEGMPTETRSGLENAGVLSQTGASETAWCQACDHIHEVDVQSSAQTDQYWAICDRGGGRHELTRDSVLEYQVDHGAVMRALQTAVGARSAAQERIPDTLWELTPTAVGRAEWALYIARNVGERDAWLTVSAEVSRRVSKVQRGIMLISSQLPPHQARIGKIAVARVSEAFHLLPGQGLSVNVALLHQRAGLTGGAKRGRRGDYPDLNEYIDKAIRTALPEDKRAKIARAAIDAWAAKHPGETPPTVRNVARRVKYWRDEQKPLP
jgi:hypothetical protein